MILLIEIMCRDQPAYRHRRKYFALLICADSSQFLVNSLKLTVDTQMCLDYAIASLNQQHRIEDIRQYTMILTRRSSVQILPNYYKMYR